MTRRSKNNPRMLPYVIRAVTDLKEVRGSTTRKILDQIHTAINVANVTPKPRNVVMGVEKALKHAVKAGKLMHKAGKYKLALDSKPDAKTKSRTRRNWNRRVKKTSNRAQGGKWCKRNILRARHSPTISSVTSERSSRSRSRTYDRPTDRSSYDGPTDRSSYDGLTDRSTTVGTYSTDDNKRLRSIRRRRRSVAKKCVKIRRSATRPKQKKRMRRPRAATPLPPETKTEEPIETPIVTNEIDNLEQEFVNDYVDPIQENHDCDNCEVDANYEGNVNYESNANYENNADYESNANYEGDAHYDGNVKYDIPSIIELPSGCCDNPECLCNLKQEPCEEINYDDVDNVEHL